LEKVFHVISFLLFLSIHSDFIMTNTIVTVITLVHGYCYLYNKYPALREVVMAFKNKQQR
jgi:hypothetical protein